MLVDTYSWRGLEGDVYLLCSDGLTSMVPEGRVADIVRATSSLSAAGRALIAAANDAGGRDNITCSVDGGDRRGARPARDQAGRSSGGRRAQPDGRDARRRPVARGARAPGRRLGVVRGAAPRRRLARRPAAPTPRLAKIRDPRSSRSRSASATSPPAVYFVGATRGFVTMYRGMQYALPAGINLTGQLRERSALPPAPAANSSKTPALARQTPDLSGELERASVVQANANDCSDMIRRRCS